MITKPTKRKSPGVERFRLVAAARPTTAQPIAMPSKKVHGPADHEEELADLQRRFDALGEPPPSQISAARHLSLRCSHA